MQLLQLATTNEFVLKLYQEFIGDLAALLDVVREEFFNMKYCSCNRQDLDKYYENMLKYFCLICNGYESDNNLKQTYLNSINETIG